LFEAGITGVRFDFEEIGIARSNSANGAGSAGELAVEAVVGVDVVDDGDSGGNERFAIGGASSGK
jgi:hypothetical protein